MGDVHPSGNPHYWLDPENGKIVARDLAGKFGALRPADKAYFDQRLAAFTARVDEGLKRWLAAMAPFKGLKVVTYHRSYPNFVERFGLEVIGYVEPRPGIPPSPSHTLALINEMKRQQIRVILMEPYFDQKTPDSVARQTGAKVVVLPPSVGGEKAITDYIALFDYNINLLVTTLTAAGATPGGGR
jgi:ABC-type Zn uptake system ZnuABC Zn-binding protein ZnuA